MFINTGRRCSVGYKTAEKYFPFTTIKYQENDINVPWKKANWHKTTEVLRKKKENHVRFPVRPCINTMVLTETNIWRKVISNSDLQGMKKTVRWTPFKFLHCLDELGKLPKFDPMQEVIELGGSGGEDGAVPSNTPNSTTIKSEGGINYTLAIMLAELSENDSGIEQVAQNDHSEEEVLDCA
jgi:hypothetical protein